VIIKVIIHLNNAPGLATMAFVDKEWPFGKAVVDYLSI
jgi:hypothetical protein